MSQRLGKPNHQQSNLTLMDFILQPYETLFLAIKIVFYEGTHYAMFKIVEKISFKLGEVN